jgi:outer membrane protein assembly factor BamD (BamD/ComL family)
MNTRTSFIFAAALLASAPALRAGLPTITVWAGDEDQESKSEKEQDLYEEGTDALDDHNWSRAVKYFDEVARMKMSHAAAALYFKATAQAEMGNRSEAVATLLGLQQSYPKSKWADDGKALELEIRQKSGEHVEVRHLEDEELKLMAINALSQSDPERAIPILEGILSGNQPMKFKEKALFVLSQSGSARAMDVVARIAKSGPPELQGRAIRFLGISGGSRARDVLADVYTTSPNIETKREVLKAYMVAGDRAHLLALAKGETNQDLRAEAVMQLGVQGARNELSELYATEPSVEVKKKIIQAMFIGGSADKLHEIATTEKNMDLKLAAIRNLGLLGGKRTGDFLLQMYQSDTRRDVREAVINGLFVQNNAKALVDLARQEKDRELKREIVQKLSVMNNKDATDYLLEFLRE